MALTKQQHGLNPVYDEQAAVGYLTLYSNQWTSYEDS
jgi:hypothetical protein